MSAAWVIKQLSIIVMGFRVSGLWSQRLFWDLGCRGLGL